MLASTILAGATLHASAEIVVIVSAKNPATRMFSEQAAQFFLGKSTLFTPVDLAEGRIRNEFYQKVADKDAAQVKALWSKLIFTGKAQAPKEYKNSVDVRKAVADDPKAIGYVERSAVDDSVKIILSLP